MQTKKSKLRQIIEAAAKELEQKAMLEKGLHNASAKLIKSNPKAVKTAVENAAKFGGFNTIQALADYAEKNNMVGKSVIDAFKKRHNLSGTPEVKDLAEAALTPVEVFNNFGAGFKLTPQDAKQIKALGKGALSQGLGRAEIFVRSGGNPIGMAAEMLKSKYNSPKEFIEDVNQTAKAGVKGVGAVMQAQNPLKLPENAFALTEAVKSSYDALNSLDKIKAAGGHAINGAVANAGPQSAYAAGTAKRIMQQRLNRETDDYQKAFEVGGELFDKVHGTLKNYENNYPKAAKFFNNAGQYIAASALGASSIPKTGAQLLATALPTTPKSIAVSAVYDKMSETMKNLNDEKTPHQKPENKSKKERDAVKSSTKKSETKSSTKRGNGKKNSDLVFYTTESGKVVCFEP
jgi:hypothetical protein